MFVFVVWKTPSLFLQVQDLNSLVPTVCLHTAVKWQNFVRIAESWSWKKLNGSFTLSSQPEVKPTIVASWLTNGCLVHPGISHAKELVTCLVIRHITILTCPKSSPNLVYHNLCIKFCSTPSLGAHRANSLFKDVLQGKKIVIRGPQPPSKSSAFQINYFRWLILSL